MHGIGLADVATLAVLAFVGLRLVQGARVASRGGGRVRVRRIVAGIGWRHVWPVPFVIAAVLAAAIALTAIPGLDWGWWTALGGTGNPVTGGSERTAGTFLSWLVPLVFVLLLLPALPLFAEREEQMFRLGAEGWTTRRRVLKAVQFGLVHALIGIPIGVALALSVGGAYFQLVYLRAYNRTADPIASMLESTRAHTAYNAVIVAVVLLAVATGGLS